MNACISRALLVLSLALAAHGCGSDDTTDEQTSSELEVSSKPARPWRPYEASERHADKTLTEWGIEYMRWTFSWTDCDVPLFDPDGAACDAFQDPDSPVFFLSQGEIADMSRCRVPGDKALLIPLIVFSTDNAGVPSDQQLSTEALEQLTQQVRETFTDLRLVVDGEEISGLESYAIEPTRYSYELGPEPNILTCYGAEPYTGVVDPSFFSGYFVLMPPPPPGPHTLEYAGVGYLHNEAEGVELATANHVRSSFSIPARHDE